MYQEIQLTVSPAVAYNIDSLKYIIAQKISLPASDIHDIWILIRSIDARQKIIKINVKAGIFVNEKAPPRSSISFHAYHVNNAQPVIIVGSGPAGLFAALQLIEKGIKPIILERGKEVSERKRDIAKISTQNIIDPNSNYCFGEGGAGTFSDGKLYTRSKKRGDLKRLIELFYYFGANENVMYESHPHIGSDFLPEVIKKMRETIIECGGEIHFNALVTDILIASNEVTGVMINHEEKLNANNIILAIGHSARDIYELLHQKNILLEQKDFAVGLRVEHQQNMIDTIQYHTNKKDPYLPAASYNLVEQVEGRGVFSFCMCPGGFIVPSATCNDEIVVNGMSPSKRNSMYANSAIVTEVKEIDLQAYHKYGPLKGLMFQREMETKAKLMAASGQQAPAQRLTDFMRNAASSSLATTSYFPGVVSSPIHEWLPAFVKESLQKGFDLFNRKMKGFVSNDAMLLGVETRTSSPVRIPRNQDDLQHVQIKGLYPCGEGSGYAGGIASSAMDGMNVAMKIAEKINKE